MIHGQFQNTTFRHSRALCAIPTVTRRGGGEGSVKVRGIRRGTGTAASLVAVLRANFRPWVRRYERRSFRSIASHKRKYFFIEYKNVGCRRYVFHKFRKQMQIYPEIARESQYRYATAHLFTKITLKQSGK